MPILNYLAQLVLRGLSQLGAQLWNVLSPTWTDDAQPHWEHQFRIELVQPGLVGLNHTGSAKLKYRVQPGLMLLNLAGSTGAQPHWERQFTITSHCKLKSNSLCTLRCRSAGKSPSPGQCKHEVPKLQSRERHLEIIHFKLRQIQNA